MLTVAVLLALTARWCLAVPVASEYFLRGARKIDGDPTAMLLDYNDYTKSGLNSGKISIDSGSPQSTGTYLGSDSTSYDPTWDWSIFGAATGQPALAEKASLDKKHKAISTASLPSFLPSIPSLPTVSLPSFLTPSGSSGVSLATPSLSSSFFPNFRLFLPFFSGLGSSNLFPTSISKPTFPTFPSTSSFPTIQLPFSGIKRSGTATINGVPAPQTQLLVFRYPDVVTFFRNGLSAIANGFSSVTSFFSGFGNNIAGNGIVISGRTEAEDDSVKK